MKRVAARSFFVVLSALALLFLLRPDVVPPVRGNKSALGEARGYFAGKLANGRDVQMRLQREKQTVTATMHLQGLGTIFVLEGPLDKQQKFALVIPPYYTAVPGQISKLTGQIGGEPPTLKGTATRGKAQETFSALQIAAAHQYTRKRSLSIAGRGGGKEFSAVWPQFFSEAPFHRTISARLAAEARGETDKFAAGAFGNMWEGLKGGGASWSYDGLLNSDVMLFLPDVVSILQERYEYEGGAHGMTVQLGRNFAMRGGKAKEFALPELFKSGSAWLPTLSAACLRDLRRQKASLVLNGEVKSFTAQELKTFTVDSAGVTIHFDAYAVGCYAEGQYHVVVPWREVRALLDPSGPAQHIPGALS